jgi:hypothetical protein
MTTACHSDFNDPQGQDLNGWRTGNCMIKPNGIDLDTPLRLRDAVKIAFPLGGMTVSGLRREIKRERLTVEIIAGKQFVSLRQLEEMRVKCRVEAKAQGSGSSQPEKAWTEKSSSRPSGSSATAQSSAALDAARAKLIALKKYGPGLSIG